MNFHVSLFAEDLLSLGATSTRWEDGRWMVCPRIRSNPAMYINADQARRIADHFAGLAFTIDRLETEHQTQGGNQ